MYRELASLDAFGVPGGPYTGAPRTFAWTQLPAPVMARLRRCLAREELPTPLLTASLGARRRVVPLVGAGALVLVPALALWLFPAHAVLPWVLAVPLMLSYAVAGRLVQQATRRDQLPVGLYLFPLDIVEATSAGVRISPFGSLKQAGIRRDGSRIELELSFEHGARYRFACADEAAAERAYARIQEAHAAVERVTYGRDLEETVDLDPFFALRGEAPWTQANKASPARRAPTPLDALAPAIGMAAGLMLFLACMMHVDNELYRIAFAAGDEASYRRYLDQGGRAHREQAIQQLGILREHAALRAQEDVRDEAIEAIDWRHEPDISLSAARSAQRRLEQDRALERYTLAAAAAPKGPKVRWSDSLHFGQHLPRIFQAARDRGDDRLYVSFVREAGSTPLRPELSASLDARERRLLAVLGRIVNETIPSNLLVVTRTEIDHDATHELTLRIHETVGGVGRSEFDLVFDVTPIARGELVAGGFQLRMPAPAKKLEHVRPRSLFKVDESSPARRATDLLTARAFDRLYDEMYGLFFPGDPKVPIALDGAKSP